MNRCTEKKCFCNLVEVYKKINEHIVDVVTRNKRVKYSSEKFNF